ncbi:CRISPR-associated helicase Cas3' [Saccharopolyspora shandongensis]|uniref:CRISPR-associated helicase Cas3' n=1 Tax=Saccharopolyspora shandongensis TaxID=418495 RepID=UPI00342CDE0E
MRNELSGSAGAVIQAGTIVGDVHFQTSRSLPVPRQLPPVLGGFVGRSEQLTALDAGLSASSSASVVGPSITLLFGTAGVGKTALAVHWAHRVSGEFPDGQLYVDLRGYGPSRPVDPGEVLAGFLRAFGVSAAEVPDDLAERAALYRSLLAERRVLVVLDNACAENQVRPLLPGSSSCQVLVTSRRVLSGLVVGEGAGLVGVDLLDFKSDASQGALDVVVAHSRNEAGDWHTLGEHARSTGALAAGFAEPWGASQLAWALGLFHDAGKVYPQWQHRLREVEGTGRSVGRHEDLGTRLLKDAAGAAAMAVLGHHRGLDSVKALKKVLRAPAKPDEAAAAKRFFAEVPEARAVLEGGSLIPPAWTDDPLLFEMGLRMTFSALVDADRLDTAAHKSGTKPVGESPVDMAALVDRFEAGRKDLLKDRDPAPMDAVRQEVYEAAVAGAQRRPDLYRLAAPTGSGKTLAQGGFALHHAARWGKRRIVVAMPLVTVTEQNAQVYRGLLDDEEPVVLEQHSQVQVDESEDADRAEWARLAAENWDAPFVLTTTVQLFETLLGRSPSQVRKLHRLANSVLVLDEVQALPPRLLLPILDGLRLLVQHFGTTVLLTSATQPAFETLSVWRNLGLEPKNLVADVSGLFERARRVAYEWRLDPQPTLAEVASEVGELDQCLVIVNSTKDARRLYRALRDKRQDVWHLSSRMYPRHRARVLDEVTSRLKDGLPVLLVATQLVEVGVDISFPIVWRAMAPADSLQQSAGRAGRHGGPGSGRVVVFDPADGHAPPEYTTRIAITRSYFGPGLADPDDTTALNAYYEELYRTLGLDRTNIRNARALNAGQTIQQNRQRLEFRAVVEGPAKDAGHRDGNPDHTKAFRMIEQNTVPVVIVDANDSAADEVRAKLKQLEGRDASPADVMRWLQGWIVTLPIWTVNTESARERLQRLGGDLHLWLGTYDPAVGVDDDPVVNDTTG